MSNFGLPPEKLKEARSKLPPIKLSSFIDPREPWVLVPDGNLLGFFHWVPRNLRVGPWSPFALPTLTLAASVLVYHRPAGFDDGPNYLHVDNYPHLYSNIWWYNFAAFLFMLGQLTYIIIYRTKGAIVTYTLLSWMMNTVRHGINAIIPYLKHHHDYPALVKLLLQINHAMRFPAMASASITFLIWNVVLFPIIYNYGFDSKEKKTNFLKFNCAFRMVQQHVCNIIYAVMNTIVSVTSGDNDIGDYKPVLFQTDDLWRGAASIFLYGIFYLLVLDRIGVHIYPVFSPRTNYVVITWCTVFSLTIGVYHFWNWIMTHYWDTLLRLDKLMTLNLGIVLLMSVVNRVIWHES